MSEKCKIVKWFGNDREIVCEKEQKKEDPAKSSKPPEEAQHEGKSMFILMDKRQTSMI